MNPYFLYQLANNRSAHPFMALISGLLTLILSFTGLRLIMMLNRKDTRMNRMFLLAILVFISASLPIIACVAVLFESGFSFFLVKLFSGAAIVVTVIQIFPTFVDLYTYFTPSINADLHGNVERLDNFTWRRVLDLLHPRTHSQSALFSNGRLAPFLMSFVGFLFPMLATLIISIQLFRLPINILQTAGLRSIEWQFTTATFMNGLISWAIFEATIAVRTKVTKIETWAAGILGVIVPATFTFFLVPKWFETDIYSGIMKVLFLGLQ